MAASAEGCAQRCSSKRAHCEATNSDESRSKPNRLDDNWSKSSIRKLNDSNWRRKPCTSSSNSQTLRHWPFSPSKALAPFRIAEEGVNMNVVGGYNEPSFTRAPSEWMLQSFALYKLANDSLPCSSKNAPINLTAAARMRSSSWTIHF